MKAVLNKFITESLFDASAALLKHLHIQFAPQSKTPLSFTQLYADTTSSTMSAGLAGVIGKLAHTYLIGAIDEASLDGRESDFDIQAPLDGKYQTMLVFAVDIHPSQSLSRTELSTLTRGFNRMAPQLPVILFVKNGDKLTLATCERSEYKQDRRSGEKLGKVSILRDINCSDPHRGHIDILESIGDKAYPTFDDLYKHWLTVFSSELLTKKFYTELSEWYAWVIGSGKVKFPNDITTTDDDAKYNNEAVIRLITRLIFVWFLSKKNLVPNELFDEEFIRDNFIENFDPHSTDSLRYNPKESKYYRLILQNLFFAMLNRPIVDEETGADENRRFVTDKNYMGINPDHNINNLMRYRAEFRPGGADKLLEIANAQIPFLNGGLFECLDHKDTKEPDYGKYFDGFSQSKASLRQLSFPDYFFFSDDDGNPADLSDWYNDKKKKTVKVRGLINILKRYNFTIEENTPLDQEVSLDPELLGKVFENLLASYNPETNSTARKQTGSFYTPREIVKYMVDESLIAHLQHKCPDIDKNVFHDLLSYSTDNFDLPEDNRKHIMQALYECKILDPACGSGAFPMGMLQQMVHALRKLDPSNEMWKEFVMENSLKRDKEAYKIEDEEERRKIRQDIEQSFNHSVNDPDYARKLYLIENCIYGVDIQPIAVQISKLRFFISLVAEQKPTADASSNFGIRPLPNLEAKFVAANTLIPLEKERNLFDESEELTKLKKQLAQLNHKLFLARRNKQKRELRQKINDTRKAYSNELVSMGTIGSSSAAVLASWDMFGQNTSAPFFDSEWMFDIANGFDIIIANPPYVSTKGISSSEKKRYEHIFGFSDDLYNLFTFRGLSLCTKGGSVTFITPKTFWTTQTKRNMRDLMLSHNLRYVFDTANPFEAVMVDTCIWQVVNTHFDESSDNLVNFQDGSSDLYKPLVFSPIKQSVYLNTQNSVIFKPTELNLKIWELYGEKVKALYDKWWDKIKTSRDIEKNKRELEEYRSSLRPGDVALLGCLTEGGQGLATANNGKYIAVRRTTKWANNIRISRPKKLADFLARTPKAITAEMRHHSSYAAFLQSLSEAEIAKLFDSLKEQYGRDIFGQGYLYKIVEDCEIADVDSLTDEEKENGIATSKPYYVPYDKGDKDGNRWYLETPFAIAWSKENVRFLKTNSGKKGEGMPVVRNPQFYFREGLCWIDVNSTYLKARIKANGVFDVLSMSLFTMTNLPNWYYVALINSELISLYVDNFINNTSHFQINDARQLPIIIPQKETVESLQKLVADCISLKKTATTDDFLMGEKQYELDRLVRLLYGVEDFH